MQANIQTDDMDARIISALGADGRRSYADVGAEVGLSTAAVHERVKKMLDKGVIRRFSISVEPERVVPIHLAVDEAFHPQLGAERDAAVKAKYDLPDRFVLYLGGFDVRKQVNELLLAYTYVVQAEGDEIPLVIAGNTKVPAKNLKEFLKLVKANPQNYSMGQPGNGTIGHLALEQLSMVSGTKFTTVPYRGDTPAMTDLLGGSIQALSAPITAFIPNLSAGKLNGLAVTSAARYPGLPNIPTAKEQGIDMVATVWFAIVGPAGLPPEIIKTLNTEVNNILGTVHGRAQLQQYGAVANTGTPDLLRKMMNEDSKKWQKVISTAGVTLN